MILIAKLRCDARKYKMPSESRCMSRGLLTYVLLPAPPRSNSPYRISRWPASAELANNGVPQRHELRLTISVLEYMVISSILLFTLAQPSFFINCRATPKTTITDQLDNPRHIGKKRAEHEDHSGTSSPTTGPAFGSTFRSERDL